MEFSEVFVLEFNEFIELLANIKSISIRFYIDIIECKYYLANKTGLKVQEDFSKYYTVFDKLLSEMGFQNEKNFVRKLFTAIDDSCHGTIQNAIKPFVSEDFKFRGTRLSIFMFPAECL